MIYSVRIIFYLRLEVIEAKFIQFMQNIETKVTDRVYEVACVKHIKITDFTSNLGTALQKLELLQTKTRD